MKRTIWFFALFVGAIVASDVAAQELRQPWSSQPVAFNYNYANYGLQTQPSPSDQPLAMEDADVVQAEEANAASGCGATGCTGSCTSCGKCACKGGCGCDEPWKLFNCGDCYGINIGGWGQMGYHNRDDGLFNTHPGRLRAQQMWLYAEKETDTSRRCWDWGGRFDILYGTDAQDTQAFGNPPGEWDFVNGFDHGIYGWAIPQAYGKIARGDWSVIAGHFYTIVGYEVVSAPRNFFYSHALTQYNSEPFTHTGILGTYSASEDVELYLGWTLGWDTGFDRLGDGSNFLGGFKVPVSGNASLAYITTLGDMGDWAAAPPSVGRGDGYAHSVVLDTDLTDNFKYVFQSDLVSLSNGPDPAHNDEFGINQYLIYTINDCWSWGNRIEWWKSDSGFDYNGQTVAPLGSNSYYEYTTGINYKPTPNFAIRPELRADWAPATGFDQAGFAVDFIVLF